MTDYGFHSSPENYGLTTVGEIDWSDGCYCFDYTTVWQRTADGVFVYGEDSGCSCPSPYESETAEGLTEIPSLSEFQTHLNDRSASNYDGTRESEIAELLERMHAAGAR